MLERVRAEGLLAPGAPVVAMLSGGRDSVCMLDLAVRAAGAAEVVARCTSTTACATTPTRTSATAPSSASGSGSELEIERPRPARGPRQPAGLGARRPLRRRGPAGRWPRDATIVTGHTADDQVETILYRLASSPSRRALLGMRPHDGRLARPLLGVTRAETTAYCEERGLAWRDDRTNAESTYARNRVRHGLLPELAAIHPAAAANVLRTAELLRDEAEVLDALVAAELDGSDGAARGTHRARARWRSCPGAAPARPAAARRRRRRPPGPRRRPLRRPGRGLAPRTGIAMLDLGGGVRAVVEGGVLRAERD